MDPIVKYINQTYGIEASSPIDTSSPKEFLTRVLAGPAVVIGGTVLQYATQRHGLFNALFLAACVAGGKYHYESMQATKQDNTTP